MKVTKIPIIFGALGPIPQELVKGLEDIELRDQVGTTQTTVFLESARIQRKVLLNWGDLLYLKPQWETISQHSSEKLSKE